MSDMERQMSLPPKIAQKTFNRNSGCCNHDHHLIQEYSRRLDAIWRYEQYIEDVKLSDQVKQFWIEMKWVEQQNIKRLKQLLKDEFAGV